MGEIKKFSPFLTIILIAVLATAVAGWKTVSDSELISKDGWGFYLWFTPIGYLILAWLFGGINKLNRPISVVGAIIAYGLSIFLLFSPHLPPGIQWHYPIGAAAIILVFFV